MGGRSCSQCSVTKFALRPSGCSANLDTEKSRGSAEKSFKLYVYNGIPARLVLLRQAAVRKMHSCKSSWAFACFLQFADVRTVTRTPAEPPECLVLANPRRGNDARAFVFEFSAIMYRKNSMLASSIMHDFAWACQSDNAIIPLCALRFALFGDSSAAMTLLTRRRFR